LLLSARKVEVLFLYLVAVAAILAVLAATSKEK